MHTYYIQLYFKLCHGYLPDVQIPIPKKKKHHALAQPLKVIQHHFKFLVKGDPVDRIPVPLEAYVEAQCVIQPVQPAHPHHFSPRK